MSEGAWDAMLRWEAETGKVIESVPGIAPAPSAEADPISSTAGLAALRAGARRAGLLRECENRSAER